MTQDSLHQTAGELARLDTLLEHRTRLGACVLLSTVDAISFSRLLDLLQETNGNLGAHLHKLEEAGYIVADKRFVAGKPLTTYALKSVGRKALKAHLDALKGLIQSSFG